MAEGASPWSYALPAVIVGAMILYYLYGAADRIGLETRQAEAQITEKRMAEGSTTYRTTVAGGRTWTQTSTSDDMYMVGLVIEGADAGGVVSRELYDTLQPGDRVRVSYQRTRFSNRLVVTGVSR